MNDKRTLFQKTRLRLTFLSGGITTLILLITAGGYLCISEHNLTDAKLRAYQGDIYTIASNLEQQTAISHAWLSGLEANGSRLVSVLDNGVPFLFDGRKQDGRQTLIDAAWQSYRTDADVQERSLSYRSRYAVFPYGGAQEYQGIVITVEKGKNTLEMLLLLPLRTLKAQILRQRLLFLGIMGTALACIWTFAWFFTGKLLRPIEENREKQDQFVAAASHELRTPLAVILSCMEAVLEKDRGDGSGERTRHNAAIAKEEALHMSALLDDMLTLAARDVGQFPIHKSPVELDTLLLSVCEAFEPMAEAGRIRLSASLPDAPLPPCACDAERIRQTLAALLHNAIRHTPEGGRVTLSLALRDGRFTLSVRDTGTGIPDAEKDKIFERFYRGEKSRSAKGHFGLGLSIAYEIVSAHGGALSVEDAPGTGACFTVHLPA